MSTKVCELDELSGWIDVEGECDGEFVDNIWDDEYLYCQVVDITIENIKYFGITKPTLVIHFKKEGENKKGENKDKKEGQTV